MKAIVYTEYGPPDILQLEEVVRPVPQEAFVFRLQACTNFGGYFRDNRIFAQACAPTTVDFYDWESENGSDGS